MTDSAVNIVDIVILAILGLTAAFAFFKGFVQEVLGIGSWIGAAIVTIFLLPRVEPWVEAQISSPVASFLLAGSLIFLITLLILWTLTHILSTRVQASSVGALNRTLGLLVGLVKGAFYVSLLFILVTWLVPGWTERPWARNSRLLPVTQAMAGWVGDAIASRARTGEDAAGYADSERESLNKLIEEATKPE